MNETAMGALLNYLRGDTPKITLPEDEFNQVCYSRWAARELLTDMMDHPMKSAQDVIFEFALKMAACEVIAREKTSGIPFGIAADFACQCLETLF